MIVYLHCDHAANITSYGFKNVRSATSYISARLKELCGFARKRTSSGSMVSLVSKQSLDDIEKLVASTKGDKTNAISTLQQAIDLYEVCTGNTSPCHTIEDIKIAV